MAVQVLGHIVPAVAGAEHERCLAFPRGPIGEAFGMQDLAGKILEPRQRRDFGNAADAVGKDDVPRTHDAFGPIRMADRHTPAFSIVVIGAVDELGAGPEIDLQRIGVILEPVGQHVLRNVFRPGRRKRHIGKMIDVDRVVQRQ